MSLAGFRVAAKQAFGGGHHLGLATHTTFLQLPTFEVPVILTEIVVQKFINDFIRWVPGNGMWSALQFYCSV